MRDVPSLLSVGRAHVPGTWATKGLFWIALVWLVKSAQPFLAPVVVALVLTFLLGPCVRVLNRRGVPLVGAAAIMVGVLVLVAALIAGAIATPAAQWWERAPVMITQLLDRVDRLRASLALGPPRPAPARAAAGSAAVAGGPADPLKERIASEGVVLTGSLVGGAASFLAQSAATLLLLFFLLISEHWIVSRIVEAFPQRRRRAIVLSGLRSAQRDISRFFGSLGLIYSGVGLATALGLAAIGMPYPVMWGILTILLNFIPYIGPALLTVMLFVAALASFGFVPIAVLPPLLFVALHATESNFISPWFVAQRLLLSPIAVFVSVLFWAWAWGVTGALIAVPVLVGLRSLSRRHRSLRLLHLLMQGRHAKAPSLRSLMHAPAAREPRTR